MPGLGVEPGWQGSGEVGTVPLHPKTQWPSAPRCSGRVTGVLRAMISKTLGVPRITENNKIV